MSRGGPQPDSKSSLMAKFVASRVFATNPEVAAHFNCTPKDADSLLRQRMRTVGDVVKRGDFWEVGKRAAQAQPGAPRMAPEFRAFSAAPRPGPMREGARDFEQIPSRIGDKRVPYMR